MKLLIVGGKGMAGHMLTQYFKKKTRYEVHFTSRDLEESEGYYLDVRDYNRVKEIIESVKPDIVINAVGILNDQASQKKIAAIQVNSLLPHQLANLLDQYGARFIHISTDCVFSGKRGDYKEGDFPDGTSDYAKTKVLGEVISPHHLTVRTSIIGPELKDNGIGLFLWFMKQKGEIKGYKKVYWNGVTTLELSKAIEKMIVQNITGLYHLSSATKISKYELLKLFQEIFEKKDVMIKPDCEIALDRTIQNTRDGFDYLVPSYEDMLIQLKDWMGNK